jgi:acyl-CoA hydrolase
LAAGVLMADIWKDQRIVTVDMLGDEFLETVQTGDPISVNADGTVEVG